MFTTKFSSLLVTTLMFAVAAIPLMAQVPSNDTFDNATPIAAFPFTDSVDTTAANTELERTCNGRVIYNSVWYKVTAAADTWVQFNTTDSNFSTFTGIFVINETGTQEYGCYDQLVGDVSSWNWFFPAGSEYYIAIGSGDPWAPGGMMHFHASPITPPPNDEIANATPVSSLPFDMTENTLLATVSSDEAQPNCSAAGNTVWFVYDATYTGVLKIETEGSNYATVLAAFSGTPGSLNQVACDGGYWFSPRLLVPVVAGQRYYIFVGSLFMDGGTLKVNLDVGPPPLSVSIQSISASVSPSNGAASVSLTVTCSRPAYLYIDGVLSQSLGQTLTAGSFFLYGTMCEPGTQTVWSGVVSQPVPHAGRSFALFRGGKALVNVSLYAYDAWYYETFFKSTTATVRMKAGR